MAIKTFLIESMHLDRTIMEHGWGNGYVIVPKGHPLHGKHYTDESTWDLDVSGGITLSESVGSLHSWVHTFDEEDKESWVFGWDTAHYMDTLAKWPKEKVQEETDRLAAQIESYQPPTPQ